MVRPEGMDVPANTVRLSHYNMQVRLPHHDSNYVEDLTAYCSVIAHQYFARPDRSVSRS